MTHCSDLYETLSNLYDKNKEVFWQVLDASDEVKEHFSLDDIIRRLSGKLKRKQWSSADCSFDLYQSLEDECKRDQEWDYSSNPSDSENHWYFDQ
jgi:hypothetical protein